MFDSLPGYVAMIGLMEEQTQICQEPQERYLSNTLITLTQQLYSWHKVDKSPQCTCFEKTLDCDSREALVIWKSMSDQHRDSLWAAQQ